MSIVIENYHWKVRAQIAYDSLPAMAKEVDVILKKKGPTQYKYPDEVWMSMWNPNTFKHEMGHHLHVKILQFKYPAIYNDWSTFWLRNKALFPSIYAKANEYEGFAVAFGRWGRNLNLHEDIREWMETNIR